MSLQAMTWAYAQKVEPTGAKFVLVTLANHASAEGYCFPSQSALAEETGQSERSVRQHLAHLETTGFITRERRSNKLGHRRSDGFWLVGFGSLPAESAACQPATLAARDESLPATIAEPTGNYRQSLPADSAAAIEDEPSLEPSVNRQLAAKPPKPRDPIWDTLVVIHRFTPTKKTPEHGRWNAAVGIYRKLGFGPGEIRAVYDLYHTEYQGMDDGALAVAGRAEHLLSKKSRAPTSLHGPQPSRPFPDYDERKAAS